MASDWTVHNHGAHPLLKHKLSVLRDGASSNAKFRVTLRDLSLFLGYEATKTFNTAPAEVATPVGATAQCERLSDNVALIPVMRAGLGMVEPMLELLPDASVFHIGMFRSKATTLLPVQYYNKLPEEHNFDVAVLLEPLVATAATMTAVIDILADWGVSKLVILSVVASSQGVDRLREVQAQYPNMAVELHVVAVDDAVDDNDMVVPGLGDVGGRQFHTVADARRETPAAAGAPASKRSRS